MKNVLEYPFCKFSVDINITIHSKCIQSAALLAKRVERHTSDTLCVCKSAPGSNNKLSAIMDDLWGRTTAIHTMQWAAQNSIPLMLMHESAFGLT